LSNKFKKVKWYYGKELEIPEDWDKKNLSEICDQIQDMDHKMPTKTKAGIPFLSISHIVNQNEIDFSDPEYISEEDYKLFLKKINPQKNDLLYSRVATIGEVRIIRENRKFAFTYNVVLIKVKKFVNSLFLLHMLNFELIKNIAIALAPQTAYRFLGLGDIEEIPILLPPLAQQQKIASILSNVDGSIQKTSEQIEKTKQFKTGLMQKLLTKGIGHTKFKKVKSLFRKYEEIPENWDYVNFGSVAKIKRGASPRPIEDPKYFGGGRGWIRISDVSKSSKYIKKTEDHLSELGELKSVPVNEGDVIMSIAATVGRPIIVKMKACIHDGFITFSNLSDDINNEFLYYILKKIENKFSSMGQQGTQSNINSKLVSKAKFVKPPLFEQRKIVSILSNVDSQIESLQSKKSQLQKTKRGLMQKLLTGKIRVSI